MKTLLLSLSIIYLIPTSTTDYNELELPEGLAFGHTLQTDLDPLFHKVDGRYLSSDTYEAQFDERGFLEVVKFDSEQNHNIPESWDLSWGTSLSNIEAKFSVLENFEVTQKDVSKSLFVDQLTQVTFSVNDLHFKFYVADWKDDNKADGLTSILVSQN